MVKVLWIRGFSPSDSLARTPREEGTAVPEECHQ